MKNVRRIVLWVVLLGIALLTVLSIIGACLGPIVFYWRLGWKVGLGELWALLRAKALPPSSLSSAELAKGMFNSVPLVVYWILLAGLLILGFVFFRRLRRSLGLLTVHLGALLVLLGAMYGSDGGHRLTAKVLGKQKVPFGYMRIVEGHASNAVFLSGKFKEQIASLPFSIGLKDFRIEYYEPDHPWVLLVESKQTAEDGKEEYVPKFIDWAEDRDRAIPFTKATVRVLAHFASARPTYGEGSVPALEITPPKGGKVTVPAELGQGRHFEDPHADIRIVEVFSNLRVQMFNNQMKVVDVPGPPENPAVRIEVSQPGQEKVYQYVYARGEMHEDKEKSPYKFNFVFAEPTGAVSDPGTGQPAVKVLLKYGQKELTRWLIIPKGKTFVPLSLGELLTDDPQHFAPAPESIPVLYLAKPRPQIRDYISDLAVLEEKQIVKEKSIEVNHPLHYGGYHFYQHSYDNQAERYTILSVASDSGLLAVYVGFVLTGAGIFWLCWLKPAWSYLTKRSENAS